jgi:hypothetical protein
LQHHQIKMPQIPNQNPEYKEEYLGYTLRYLNDPNGTWKFIVPEEQFRYPDTKKVYHIRRGERDKAHELFYHIVGVPMTALDGSKVHEIHLVYGGDLKAENKVVDGGQVMKKCFYVNGEAKVYNIWDPFPPPPKIDIPEPEEIVIASAPAPIIVEPEPEPEPVQEEVQPEPIIAEVEEEVEGAEE